MKSIEFVYIEFFRFLNLYLFLVLLFVILYLTFNEYHIPWEDFISAQYDIKVQSAFYFTHINHLSLFRQVTRINYASCVKWNAFWTSGIAYSIHVGRIRLSRLSKFRDKCMDFGIRRKNFTNWSIKKHFKAFAASRWPYPLFFKAVINFSLLYQ